MFDHVIFQHRFPFRFTLFTLLKEATMLQKLIRLTGIFMCLSLPAVSQELTLSTAQKTYSTNVQVWVNLSITDATSLPGAYSFDISFRNDDLSFVTILPAEDGPFTITPAASAEGNTVRIAGFQGITQTGTGTVSLATLVFLPLRDQTVVDTSYFSVAGTQVYTTNAETMEVTLSKRATSVLLPAPQRKTRSGITLSRSYLTFSVIKSGITTVHIYNLNGRVVERPLFRKHCRAGTHGVPLPSGLRSGIYIARVNGNGFTATQKLEVVR